MSSTPFGEHLKREREMRQFGVALGCLFLLVMTFAWQHFKAIEYGYKIEALRIERSGLVEENHALQLEESSLRDPQRIDGLVDRCRRIDFGFGEINDCRLV